MNFQLIISLILLLILFPLALNGFSMAPWVPSRKRDCKGINDLADLQKNETFIELGSGDGRVSFYIAQKNPQAQVTGIEIAYSLYFWSKIKRWWKKTPNLSFKLQNIFNHDLSFANVIFLYGMPKAINNRLQKKLHAELKPGTKVISYIFRFKNWEPVKIFQEKNSNIKIYLYKI